MFYTVLLILNSVWNIKIISLAGSATELLWGFSQGSFFVQYAEIKFYSPTTRKIPFFQKSRIVNKWKIPGGIAYVEQQLIKKGFHSKSKLKTKPDRFRLSFSLRNSPQNLKASTIILVGGAWWKRITSKIYLYFLLQKNL